MDASALTALLDNQAGVVSRPQLLALGAVDSDIRRWVRRRRLRPIYRGVYVNHTGPLTWANRSWAAVLVYWPSALSHDSVVNQAGDLIHVAIDASRNVSRRPGVKVHLLADFDDRVQWNLGPPRVRLEDALLMMCAASATRLAALTLVTDACTRRRTTPERLLTELARQRHLKHRSWIRDVLAEAADGVRSPLESAYLRRVERAHGLPRGRRQVREETGLRVVYRDIRYEGYGVLVELDGRVGHELSRDRWNDMDRDLEAAVGGDLTIRLGWRHTEDHACETAARLAAVLRSRGWDGDPRPCGPTCRARSDTDPRISVRG